MNKVISNSICELNNTVYYFLNGGCYIFAKHLRGIVGGDLYYLIDECHFILKLGSKFYDASGNVTSKYKDSKMITESEFLKRDKLVKSIRA